ncbi:MAG: YbaY family lipoprotein [Spongiibacteraceae bacterium]
MLRILQLGLIVLLSGCASVQMSQLSGNVSYRERIALPPEAELRIALEDVSIADAPPRLVAEQLIRPTTQVPIPFALTYDARAIEADHRYRLIGEIRNSANQLLWRTKDPADPFAKAGASNAIELVLKRVGGIDKPLPTWHYRCDDVDFTFVPGSDDNAGLYFDNRHYQVKHVPSGSGARYEGGGVMFWSKGRDGVLSVGGKTYAGCTGEPQ